METGQGLGVVALFGSGETGKHGRHVQERLMGRHAPPVRVAIVETPAGFQPNVAHVSDRLRVFFEHNLQNHRPRVTIVPARHRGGPGDPDDPAVAALLADADYVFAGPGSPTYAVRHLSGSATLAALEDRLCHGATLALASAAAIAAGAFALPVYEVFKVGDDPAWVPGLDILRWLGLRVAVVPHWNNHEGGADLDTTHAFVGAARFATLRALLPREVTVLGIDEHTALVLDPAAGTASIEGAGGVTVIRAGQRETFATGSGVPLSALAPQPPLPILGEGETTQRPPRPGVGGGGSGG